MNMQQAQKLERLGEDVKKLTDIIQELLDRVAGLEEKTKKRGPGRPRKYE